MLTDTGRCTVRLVFGGVNATEAENVQSPLVTGSKFSHFTVADANRQEQRSPWPPRSHRP
jgi:hypothetical protein